MMNSNTVTYVLVRLSFLCKNEHMKQIIKISKIVSYSSLAAALVIGAAALFFTWRLYSQLPPGVCPLTTYQPWIYLALALALISLVASYIETTVANKEKRREKEELANNAQDIP